MWVFNDNYTIIYLIVPNLDFLSNTAKPLLLTQAAEVLKTGLALEI